MPDDAVYTPHGATLTFKGSSECLLKPHVSNVLGPAPSVLSENVLGMQVLKAHLRPPESETLLIQLS